MEFQKRGLPHAHILLILHAQDALRDVDDWDTAVSAELPDEDQFPEVCLCVDCVQTVGVGVCTQTDFAWCV